MQRKLEEPEAEQDRDEPDTAPVKPASEKTKSADGQEPKQASAFQRFLRRASVSVLICNDD